MRTGIRGRIVERMFTDQFLIISGNYCTPKKVDINACTLSYEIDSKGFYQPVYVFQIQFDEIEIPLSVKIPAIL